MKKYHLLAPGPTPIPPEVLQAIAQPILHHRTPAFEALFGRVRTGLSDLIGTRGEVIILAASGTGAGVSFTHWSSWSSPSPSRCSVGQAWRF